MIRRLVGGRSLLHTNHWTCSFFDGLLIITSKVKLSLCSINYVLCQEGIWESGCRDPHILDLSTSWS
jgi:hypothetical protein